MLPFVKLASVPLGPLTVRCFSGAPIPMPSFPNEPVEVDEPLIFALAVGNSTFPELPSITILISPPAPKFP